MNLTVKRVAKKDAYTIGKLYIDGVYFCDTLEDKDRGLKQSDDLAYITKHKVYGETAIPTGTYNVSLTYSTKFKKILPLIENVKGFSGIRIHSGNTAQDSLGCILVGKNTVVGKVTNSRDAFNALFEKLQNQKIITITIK